jgi:lysophospholipase L1-like esterase
MSIMHNIKCLIGRHRRDARNAHVDRDRVFSRCIYCGVAMVKASGKWRARGINRIQIYFGSIALVFLVILMLLLVVGRNHQDLVVFVGDSITAGDASSDPMTLSRPGLYQTHVGNSVIVANEGISGITLGSLAGQVSSIERYYRSGRKNVVIIDGGSNDFAFGAKASPLFKILQDYVGRLRDDGWIVGVATIMPRNGLSPEQERERQAFNRMIVTGPLRTQGVGILDYDAEHRAGRIQIADGVHPSDAGYAAMSKLDIAFIDRALGRR